MAGLVLDLYDDPEMRVLRQTYPQPDEMPDFIKEANVLDPAVLASLPDDHFALVLVGQDGTKMRKYAMVNAAHTALSAIYLLEAQHLLTEDAMKTASARLVSACLQQGLEPPVGLLIGAQEKLADLYPSSTLRRLTQPDSQAGDAPVSCGDPSSIPYADNFPDPTLRQQAEALSDQDSQMDVQRQELQLKEDQIRLDAKRLELSQIQQLQQQPEQTEAPAQAPGVEPYVEDGSAPPQVTTKQASVDECLMVNEEGRGIFPVRDYGEAEKAAAYFVDRMTELTPVQRREYCTKLAARVHPWGVRLPDVIEKYASFEVDPIRQVYFDLRKQNCDDPEICAQYDGLSKVASAVDPEVLIIALTELDKQAGLNYYYDRGIPDPYFSLFGKTAGDYVNDEWGWTNDLGDTLTRDALNNLLQVESYRKKLEERFDSDFVKALSTDPINIFESLPDQTKTLIARIAAPSV